MPRNLDALNVSLADDSSRAEKIIELLRVATRAPSTHNSQPWLFDIRDRRLSIYLDPSVELPQSDPVGRYAHISIGFLLHHVCILGLVTGLHPVVKAGADGALVDVWFTDSVPDLSVENIADAIFSRRNRRGNFLHNSVPNTVLRQVTQVPKFFPSVLPTPNIVALTSRPEVHKMAELTAESMRRVYHDLNFRREMSRWIAPTGSGRMTGIPAYSLNVGAIFSWILPRIIRTFNIGSKLASLNALAIDSAPVSFGLSCDETPEGWVATGFLASHTILTLHANGISSSIFVASIESEDTRREATQLFSLDKLLQFHFVAGFLPAAPFWETPRIPVEYKLRH